VRQVWVKLCVFLGVVVGLLAAPSRAFAQADEIQVYDASLASKGVFNLTWHNNFTPNGIKTPAFPGGITTDKSLNGVTEWALGVSSWFEAGLYLPLYSYDKDLGFKIDGLKLRTLFASPNANDRKLGYGVGMEFSYNAKHWDESRITSEIRPILAWHPNTKVDLIVNPILDTAYDGVGNMVFAPSARLAYNRSDAWAVALESYADFGQLKGFAAVADQSHQLFAVIDHTTKSGYELEFGAGVGLTNASDKFVLKLLVAKDLGKLK